ncbi:MAG: pilus assembly protein [Candidatus Eremiobacteraeota bacterium]|nr:pilus assembly protein [Candidatus Eremiobacteraeota bacterium]MBV8499296.1 pilus assembly protein [Candidatus Eremiobacteraeota bacterium]
MSLTRCERGTSLVEFAIVLPIMIFMFLGFVELGRYGYYAILAANAARAGVQYAVQSPGTALDTAGVTNAARADGENLSSWIVTTKQLCSVKGAAPTQCTIGTGSPPANTIYYVQVQVSGTYRSLLSYPGIPTNVPISGSAMMRVAFQ